ncbi:chorismate-binding protein [Paenarthrobacter sp. Z7-10]|uniref:chorismate-binding protein n=1 Tax=Paenarthrobacter sp. Z7-10 TaxID=2787635 RepID=UPI0022A9012A|nr:chorismate-binding protein [Paenarthrobacter sp. Z7-10]MCZ2401861.1 chorismate-binding protein [Paenarthrobacter sp. Z7-10]
MHSANLPTPTIIAIDGRSGAGKTTLALELAALLREHRRVSVFHLEDIYPGWNGLTAGIERYVTTVLAPLREGLAAHWASWDWDNHYDGEQRTTALADVIIVEGVGAAHATARPFLDTVLWVEAGTQDRKLRALARDGDSFAPFWDQWAAQEDELLAGDPVADEADLLIAGSADGSAPGKVLQALTALPALEALLTPERTRRRTMELSIERLERYPDAADIFAQLYGDSENALWLDSSNAAAAGAPAETNGDAAERSRFSILADDGGSYGQLARHAAGSTRISSSGVTTRIDGPFFRWLETVWGGQVLPAPEDYDCGFTLGWVGYLGYQLKRETGGAGISTADSSAANLPPFTAGSSVQAGSAPDAEAPVPTVGGPDRSDDASLIFAGRAVVVDHHLRCLYLLALTEPAVPSTVAEAKAWTERTRAVVSALPPAPAATAEALAIGATPTPAPRFTARDSEFSYKMKIAQAQAEIADGNSYEVCLTTALTSGTAAALDPCRTYLRLRAVNPAPFAAFLRFGPLAIASTSPERFLRITAGGRMRAEPIKGTRRRDPDPDRDESLRMELETSPKDRAENIMIVDLLRNDLSHFAIPDTLCVPRLCVVESYATVHQLVSTIEAQLQPGSSRAEAVAAAFPAGSMTGVPKVSTMAILDRLEGAPRGIYSGAIGYFSLSGAADLSVTIRTLVMEKTAHGGRLSLGVGGAITSDSSPHEEWLELKAKAGGVLQALGTHFPG